MKEKYLIYSLIFLSLFLNVLQFKNFYKWLSSPYFNLVIPESGKFVRVELNRMIPSTFDKEGFVPQFKFPETNGNDFKRINTLIYDNLKRWPFNEKPVTFLDKIDWSKVNENKVP